MLLSIYQTLTGQAAIPLKILLKRRLAKGKEHETRWIEKTGITDKQRPDGTLLWLHAASVGEAQSALILINKIKETYSDISILVTSGTLTSANMLENRLPNGAFHQFVPLDHPKWVNRFLDHWKPDIALWLESELWPNILHNLKERSIPTILLNARLSPKSFNNWKKFPKTAKNILSSFSLIISQTDEDKKLYRNLGAVNVLTGGNIKYSAQDLPADDVELSKLKEFIGNRPIWVYASTHESEEQLTAEIHQKLKQDIPNLLSIIVPRHPERGEEIETTLNTNHNIRTVRRTTKYILPKKDTDIYLADTLGELGLFYRMSPIAVIGRSFSNDGGGGHNPIEAAQLGCAVLHGPNVQNLQKIYDDMAAADACISLENQDHFYQTIKNLLQNPNHLKTAQNNAKTFCKTQDNILETIWQILVPYLDNIQDKGMRHANS